MAPEELLHPLDDTFCIDPACRKCSGSADIMLSMVAHEYNSMGPACRTPARATAKLQILQSNQRKILAQRVHGARLSWPVLRHSPHKEAGQACRARLHRLQDAGRHAVSKALMAGSQRVKPHRAQPGTRVLVAHVDGHLAGGAERGVCAGNGAQRAPE